MNIPTYEQWKKDTTLGITKPRSKVLQALDAAIEKYNKAKNQDNLWAIKNAFEDWKRSKGPAWDRSERNKNNVITKLAFQLDQLDYRTYQITHMSIEELRALEYMKSERTQGHHETLPGRERPCETRGAQGSESAESLDESARRRENQIRRGVAVLKSKFSSQPAAPKPFVVTGMGTAPGGGAMGVNLGKNQTVKDMIQAKLQEMVQKFFEVDSIALLGPLTSLVLTVVAECAASAAPVIGHIKDGIAVVDDWVDVGLGLYHQNTISRCSYSIELGAPAAAFAALEKLLKDQTQHSAISAGINTTSFAAKTGLLFADGGAISGPVVGAVNALAQIAHTLYLLGMEYRATKDANAALAAGHLDITLFETYPLMGCYLLNCATLSDIIPIKCFATPGWKDYIEHMKKGAIDNILKQSSALIDKSPWEIKDMPKRPVGSSGGLVSEGKRYEGFASPLSGIAGLASIGKKS